MPPVPANYSLNLQEELHYLKQRVYASLGIPLEMQREPQDRVERVTKLTLVMSV